jgi:hypothetical protein
MVTFTDNTSTLGTPPISMMLRLSYFHQSFSSYKADSTNLLFEVTNIDVDYGYLLGFV